MDISKWSFFAVCPNSCLNPLCADHPLASNFSILDGWYEITVPSVPAGTDYTIVCEYPACTSVARRRSSCAIAVFGDSGNDSGEFTIAPAMLAAEVEL